MTIQRNPNAVFAAIWLGWSAYLIFAVVFPSGATLLILWAAFFAVEGAAQVMKNGGQRDTLSEVSTWVHRKLSKHRVAWKGWNALLFTPFVIIVGLNIYRTFALANDPAAHIVGAVVAGFAARGLYGHIVNVEEHG